MANPLLNDKAFSKAVERTPDQAGWAAPKGGSAADAPTTWNAPISDGPVSPWRSANPMTANGAMSATLFLMVLLVGAATYGWSSVQTIGVGEAVSFPSWAMIAFIVGFVSVLVATFKPTTARFLAPVYALAQGAVVGAISKVFNIQYPGIVLQAVGATIGVFVVMLTLYRTGILRVTDKFRRIVIGATMGVALFYGVSLLMSLFGATPPFIQSTSLLGIGFSFLVAGLAAFNLALDFDFIERGSKQGMPESTEWYAAFGVMVTVVWLYLEILRLLSKLRER